MTFTQYKRAVGVIADRREVELALNELKEAGFPLHSVSVIARNGTEELKSIDETQLHQPIVTKAKTGLAKGAVTGGTLGGLYGLFLSTIPGIGHVIFAGAVAHTLATTIACGMLGTATGSLTGGLIGLGIDEERAQTYHQQVANGYYLLIIEGTEAEIERAEQILDKYNLEEWDTYDVDLDTLANDPEEYYLRAIAVFPRLQDAKTAIINLIKADFPLSSVTMIAGAEERHDWFPNLTVHNFLDHSFERLPDNKRAVFQDYFDRNAYIVTINGTRSELQRAETIFQSHNLEYLYQYNPFQLDRPSNSILQEQLDS